jgi:hypothetical protein
MVAVAVQGGIDIWIEDLLSEMSPSRAHFCFYHLQKISDNSV